MPKVLPGLWLRSRWEHLGFSASSLARQTKLARSTIARLAVGGRLTAQVAHVLARPLKLPPAAVAALLRADEVDEDEMARLVDHDPPA
jgi:plasmid maintenance system antidote protein VapI